MTDMAADLKQRFSQFQDAVINADILGAGLNSPGVLPELPVQGVICPIVG